MQSELKPSAREDVPAERTVHERHERREAVELRVDALKGSRDSLSFSFHLGLCANACGRRLSGDTIEQYKCCRVFA